MQGCFTATAQSLYTVWYACVTNSIPERERESHYDGQNWGGSEAKVSCLLFVWAGLGTELQIVCQGTICSHANFISALMKLKQLSVELSALLYTQHNCGVTTVKPQWTKLRWHIMMLLESSYGTQGGKVVARCLWTVMRLSKHYNFMCKCRCRLVGSSNGMIMSLTDPTKSETFSNSSSLWKYWNHHFVCILTTEGTCLFMLPVY